MKNSYLQTGSVKASLDSLRKAMGAINVVCGVGPIPADIMIIGEAPGQNEDEEDMPFVGRSGDLLNVILKNAGLNRAELYITNTVKCRPTSGKKNRPPTDDEISQCKGILWEEIKEVRPVIIVTLGLIPTKTLITTVKKSHPMSDYVGRLLQVDYTRAAILPIWHPSFLLRSKKVYMDTATELFKNARDFVASTKNNP